MKRVQVENIQWLINEYGGMLFSGAYIVGVDHYEELNGADLVLYDIRGLEGVSSQRELSEWCDKNGGDEEVYEVDRATIIRIDDF